MNIPYWLESLNTHLTRLMDESRLPHALWISGTSGWGQDLFVSELSTKLVGENGDGRQIAHPDLRWIEPDEGIIKVEPIRQLNQFLLQTAQSGETKVAVINHADRMNKNASNALLKILEEPPNGSFMILNSQVPKGLSSTVVSRCQKYNIQPLEIGDLNNWLMESGLSADEVKMYIIEYGEAPFDILVAKESDREPLWELLKPDMHMTHTISELAEKMKHEDLVELLSRWIRYTHYLIKFGSDFKGLDFYDRLIEVKRMAVTNTGLNKQMQLEMLLTEWRKIKIDIELL